MAVASAEFVFPVKPDAHADPPTDEVEVQYVPGFLSDRKEKECVTLQPGGTELLDHRLDAMALNFNWSFRSETARFDVDSSVALFKRNFAAVDFVWWDNPKTRDGSVKFLSGDNTGNADDTKESISVHLKKIPAEVFYLVIAISVYSKDHELADLKDVTLSALLATDTPIIQYKVTPAAPVWMRGGESVGESWAFHALAEAVPSRTILELLHEPSNLNAVQKIQAEPQIRRSVLLQPLEGRDLTPMDFTLFKKRSDPYLKIFVDDKAVVSEVCYATLNPTFVCQPLDLGEVSETSTKVVEIQCWDYDKLTKHDIMGVIKICLGGLMAQLKTGENKVWLKLLPSAENIKEKKKITGDILIDFLVRDIA